MPAQLLTTGKAARLCSVKPDTVLKWIKKGRLPATRTVGGHYRVEEGELFHVLAQEDPPAPAHEVKSGLCSRPLRCWEFMSNDPGGQCRDCVVYRVRATWCFRMKNVVRGNGHMGRFCTGLCQECPYYRRVHGLPSNVLVITQDESLIQNLASRESGSLAFRFARRGYDASAIVSVFRPALVVFDMAILEILGMALLEALASDPRTLGTRILVAVRKDVVGFRLPRNAVFATVQEPFDADEIVAVIHRIPVETLEPEPLPAHV